MTKLVLVHGRSQEGKDPTKLKRTWVDALEAGLAKSGLALPVKYEDIAFPFYGDILDNLVDGDPKVITRGAPDDAEELRFKVEMMEAMARRANLTDAQIREASGDPTIERGPLNWEWVQGIMRAFDKHLPAVGGALINLITHDVYVYLRRPGVRDEVDKIVRDAIPDGEECIVVGHSLGSVVTYGILKRDESKLNVPLYVTVGSPLATGPIQGAFHPVNTPTCVGLWYNAMDDRDVVALYPLAPPDFVVDPEVVNNTKVKNPVPNHHGITGYLGDTDVAKQIYGGL